eukprot:NODE_1544_length_857_cov_542.710396_g1198_i0.p2 GENE.NODE_1544_length_857_cov_542.710396_g1198_i0~~NODE_1544_length_857_cov_542.710396_g1198_i0.p2  ORF type:complete len:142 (+),score=42.52 NODE_1544_length_857_cov_542.710396_g1198_i0:218-643(+)
MKPAWDQLGLDYADHRSVIIADVDCTEQQELCEEKGVQGYPTIKYYTTESGAEGNKYTGGRDAATLTTFVQETLEAKCDVTDVTTCTEKEQSYISKMSPKSKEEQEKELARLEGMKDNKFKSAQKQYLFARINVLQQLLKQ